MVCCGLTMVGGFRRLFHVLYLATYMLFYILLCRAQEWLFCCSGLNKELLFRASTVDTACQDIYICTICFIHIIKLKNNKCEIEDFVETHLLCIYYIYQYFEWGNVSSQTHVLHIKLHRLHIYRAIESLGDNDTQLFSTLIYAQSTRSFFIYLIWI